MQWGDCFGSNGEKEIQRKSLDTGSKSGEGNRMEGSKEVFQRQPGEDDDYMGVSEGEVAKNVPIDFFVFTLSYLDNNNAFQIEYIRG